MKKKMRVTVITLALVMALQTTAVMAEKLPEADEITLEVAEKEKQNVEKKNNKEEKENFTKEELRAKKQEYHEKRITLKEYNKQLKENFGKADAEVKKEILAEIAKGKAELKDWTIDVFAKGKNVDFDKYDGVEPEIKNNRTLVPVRAVAESLDASVVWNDETKEIIIKKENVTVVLTIDENIVLVNGEEFACEAAPYIKKNRTMVPVRIICEAFGEKVEWDQESKSVIIEEAVAEEADNPENVLKEEKGKKEKTDKQNKETNPNEE